MEQQEPGYRRRLAAAAADSGGAAVAAPAAAAGQDDARIIPTLSYVVLRGFGEDRGMNGKVGTVHGFDPADGRYATQLLRKPQTLTQSPRSKQSL